jgi:hypothetical protein
MVTSVHLVKIYFRRQWGRGPYDPPLTRCIWDLFSKTLRVMTSLRHLSFIVPEIHLQGSDMGHCSSMFAQYAFRLLTFNSSLKLDQNLLQFLLQQSELRYLKLSYDPLLHHIGEALHFFNLPVTLDFYRTLPYTLDSATR